MVELPATRGSEPVRCIAVLGPPAADGTFLERTLFTVSTPGPLPPRHQLSGFAAGLPARLERDAGGTRIQVDMRGGGPPPAAVGRLLRFRPAHAQGGPPEEPESWLLVHDISSPPAGQGAGIVFEGASVHVDRSPSSAWRRASGSRSRSS